MPSDPLTCPDDTEQLRLVPDWLLVTPATLKRVRENLDDCPIGHRDELGQDQPQRSRYAAPVNLFHHSSFDNHGRRHCHHVESCQHELKNLLHNPVDAPNGSTATPTLGPTKEPPSRILVAPPSVLCCREACP